MLLFFNLKFVVTTYAQFDLREIIYKGSEMVATAYVLRKKRRNSRSRQNL